MSDVTERPRTGMRPWLKVVLALSLILNLMVIGVVVGFGAKRFDDDRRGGGKDGRSSYERVDPALGPVGRALPSPHREAAGRAFEERVGPREDARQFLAQQLSTMVTLLRADPFDAEAFADSIEAQRRDYSMRSDVGREVVIEQIKSMSPEHRYELADRLEWGFRKALKHDGGKDH